jgi:pimeloyl-ACP methyl ester carboxylesterase
MPDNNVEPLVIAKQGSFFAGGTVTPQSGSVDLTRFAVPRGDAGHVNHAYVQYQIPVNARRLPIVMWGGGGQTGRAWETTPDGREGFQNLLLRQDWPVYTLDQPGRGRAGRASMNFRKDLDLSEASIHTIDRFGVWPEFFPGVQLDTSPSARSQFWRQSIPYTEPPLEQHEIVIDAVSAVFDEIGPGMLLTHSASGKLGLRTRIKNSNIQANIAYEPTTYIWPSDAPPPEMEGLDPVVTHLTKPIIVSPEQFDELIKMPIQVVFGDNIPKDPSPYPGLDFWRVIMIRVEQFAEVANRRGGDVEILRLPDAGLTGNTHYPFSDLNNGQVADLLTDYLTRKGLADKG